MPVPRPTQPNALSLRIISNGREELFLFRSIDRLARDLAIRLAAQELAFRHSVRQKLVTNVQGCGTLLRTTLRTTTTTYPNHTGPVDVVRERDYCTYEVFSCTGVALQIAAIVSRGTALETISPTRQALYRTRRYRLYIGYGPVPGIRKWRCGSCPCLRKIGTMPERRLNALVLTEEFEVGVRGARRGENIPDSWDDFFRRPDRSWKAQRKGRKSWDRP